METVEPMDSSAATTVPTFFSSNVTQMTTSKFMYSFFSGRTFRPEVENLFITIYVLVGTSGFLFNTLLIILVVRSSTLQYFPYNILLLNQMVSNIFMACISIPFTLISFLYRSWNFGWFLCKSIPTIQVSESSLPPTLNAPLPLF